MSAWASCVVLLADKLDLARQQEAVSKDKSHEASEEERRALAELQTDFSKTKTEIANLEHKKRVVSDDKSEALQLVAKLELDVQELEGLVSNEDQDTLRIDNELMQLKKNIAATSTEIERVEPQLQKVTKDQELHQAEHDAAKARQEDLFSKQTRTSQFSSEEQRDRWIDSELKSLSSAIKEKAKSRKMLAADVEKTRQRIADDTEEIEEREDQIKSRRKRIEEINTEHRQARTNRDQLTNQRKKLWADDAALDNETEEAKSQLHKAVRSLHSSIGKVKAKGLETVRKIAEEHNIPGIYGPLIELVSCSDEYKTSVEVTAGDQLFNIVVDSDQTASKIIRIMNQKRMEGRITFLPLNRLSNREPNIPKGRDFVAMIKKIEFDPKFRPAVLQVFGRTLICRDLEVAAHYSREEGITCVTLDGDKVNRRGALSGGYVDEKASKLDLQKTAFEQQSRCNESQDRAKKVKTQIVDVDAKVTQQLSLVEKLESERNRLRQNHEHLNADTKQLAKGMESLKKSFPQKEAALATADTDLGQMKEKVQTLQAEKGTSLDSQLDEADQAELRQLTDEIARCQPLIMKCLKERRTLEQTHARLRRKLDNNLKKRESELLHEHETFGLVDRKEDLAAKRLELENSLRAVKTANTASTENESLLSKLVKRRDECSNALDEARTEERKRETRNADSEHKLERIMSERQTALAKQETLVREIRDLGALPKDFEKYQDKSLKQLHRQLTAINKKLKQAKFQQVNKKALDQYVSFSEQRDALLGRKSDQDSADQSIQDLIQVLDNQKDEAIERTFKQVSKYFSEVFQELCPTGRANLIMQKRPPGQIAQDTQGDAIEDSESGGATKAGKDKVCKQHVALPRASYTHPMLHVVLHRSPHPHHTHLCLRVAIPAHCCLRQSL